LDYEYVTHMGTILKGHCPTVDAVSLSKANTLRLVQSYPQMLPLCIWYSSLSNVTILRLARLTLKCGRSASGAGPFKGCDPTAGIASLTNVVTLRLVLPTLKGDHPAVGNYTVKCNRTTLGAASLSKVNTLQLVKPYFQTSLQYSWYLRTQLY
jgi:hypothetical protein